MASHQIISALTRTLAHRRRLPQAESVHINAAIDWLLQSSDVVDRAGFAAGYYIRSGWGQPYIETTGYIIPTLLNCAATQPHRRDELTEVSRQAGEWLLTQQNPDGSFNGYQIAAPVVFDTGQVIFGLVALYHHTHDTRYLGAINRAADWLVSVQDVSGAWTQHTYNNQPHAYHARVAWALLVAYQVTDCQSHQIAAVRNLDWVVSGFSHNGWHPQFGFLSGAAASLHTIGYTLRGLVESGRLLNRSDYLQRARQLSDQLAQLTGASVLSGEYDGNWQMTSSSQCLTGLAQVAISWQRLGHHAPAVQSAINYIKSCQDLRPQRADTYGALSGSWPIWGRYLPWTYPNWSVKFFIDTLLLQHSEPRYAG